MINGRCRSAGTHEEAWSLPGGVTADAIASACREAGLQFLEGVAGDWGKADLALWLAGPYRDATRFGAPIRGSTPPPPEPRMSAPGGLGAQIDRITSHMCDLAVFDCAVPRPDKLDSTRRCNRTADAPGIPRPVPRGPRSLGVSKGEPGELHILDETSRLRLPFEFDDMKYLSRHNHLCRRHVLAEAG